MSDCKIKQNMEFIDIIYFILFLFFAILGFFNDSKKKKKITQQQKSEDEKKPVSVWERDREWIKRFPVPKVKDLPPPTPHPAPHATERAEFQSSLDLVTDFEGLSSLRGSIYVDDEDSVFLIDKDVHITSESVARQTDKRGYLPHPLLIEINSDEGFDALKKGLIYGEIMQRKY